MRRRYTYFTLILISFLLSSNSILLYAQPEKPMHRFREEKMKYFNEHLELTDAEAEKLWPVYEDFHNRMMKINEDEMNLLDYFSSNLDAMSDEEIDEISEKYFAIQASRGELIERYHNKFVKIIGKKKTMHMYALEVEFRKYVLEQFRNKEGGSGEGRKHGFGRQ